jgi:hypothetical protein
MSVAAGPAHRVSRCDARISRVFLCQPAVVSDRPHTQEMELFMLGPREPHGRGDFPHRARRSSASSYTLINI